MQVVIVGAGRADLVAQTKVGWDPGKLQGSFLLLDKWMVYITYMQLYTYGCVSF